MSQAFETIYPALNEALRTRFSTVVAIDGPCASGKTTLAETLRARFGARVIPMDDFFLPQALRTPVRYGTPGGNVHYERFLEEIAPSLCPDQIGKVLSYLPFDCKTMSFRPRRQIPWSPLTVVEGSYSLHDALRHLYDIRIFLSVDAREQERRILSREGPEGLAVFLERWIPLENLYFNAVHPERFCDFIL
ncbi:MAG: uridine kinase [Eubacteriales bacterium]|nr:uridine kinase [Eubacteriales bacterium]MDD3863546.1 uridine kinase [Eubacteriales bacterium]